MKKIYFLLLSVAFLLTNQAYAQQYSPVEQKMQMDEAMADAWVISADEEPVADLRKSFARFTKDQLGIKSKKDGKNMMVAREASIPRIADQVGDLRAKFYTEGGETKVAVAFMPGYDISLSTAENPDEMESLRKFTKNFVKYHMTEKFTAQIEDQEDRKKKIESNLKKNEREYSKLQKSLDKIAKKVESDKTEASEKYELKNEKIEHEARIMALDEVMANQEKEITQVEDQTQESRSSISRLETLFAEPVARKSEVDAPQKASGDSVDPISPPTNSPDVDY